MKTVLNAGDKLIVIAEDDDAIKLGAAVARPDATQIALTNPPPPKAERSLILGWNWRGTNVVNELDAYVPLGSTVHVVADAADAEASIKSDCAELERLTLTFQQADTTDRRVLDELDVASFDHVIVLCYSDDLDVAKADARTLITLLHLRDISQRTGKRVSIVAISIKPDCEAAVYWPDLRRRRLRRLRAICWRWSVSARW